MYNFCSNIRKLEYKNKIVLVNTKNGKWMRLSKTVYQIIQWSVDSQKEHEELMSVLADKEDRKYVSYIIRKLLETELIFKNRELISNNKTVLFEVTNRCNLQCLHCCNSAESFADFELGFDEVIKILDILVDREPDSIILTGGEPLIRNDFLDIILKLRKQYTGKIVIMTNGTLINESNVKQIIENVDEINISMDGVDEKTTALIRGTGVFTKVLNAIVLLHKNNFTNITLSMVISSSNYCLEETFLELNKKLGTAPLLRGMAEVGRAKNNKLQLSREESGEYLEKVFSDENITKQNTKKISPCTCTAGMEKILIDYKGNVFPCQWFKEKGDELGNILKNEKKEFHLSKNIECVNSVLPWNHYKCRNCEVNCFCWPCPGELREKSKNQNEIDEICRMIKPILFKKIWDEEIIMDEI